MSYQDGLRLLQKRRLRLLLCLSHSGDAMAEQEGMHFLPLEVCVLVLEKLLLFHNRLEL